MNSWKGGIYTWQLLVERQPSAARQIAIVDVLHTTQCTLFPVPRLDIRPPELMLLLLKPMRVVAIPRHSRLLEVGWTDMEMPGHLEPKDNATAVEVHQGQVADVDYITTEGVSE